MAKKGKKRTYFQATVKTGAAKGMEIRLTARETRKAMDRHLKYVSPKKKKKKK